MKKHMGILALTVMLCAVTGRAAADSTASDIGSEQTVPQNQGQTRQDAQTERAEKTEKKEELDEIEKARQALLYGLESEVLEVTGKIDKQDFEALMEDFNRLFSETKSAAVREALFNLYKKYDNTGLMQPAQELLKEYKAQQRTAVKAALSYLAVTKSELNSSLNETLRELLTEEPAEYGVEAVAVLGETGSDGEAAFLTEYFENFTIDDAKQELILKQAIASALEKLHCENTRDFLLERAQDETENVYIRASAVTGLARMGDADIVPLLIEFFGQGEPLLREAALRGSVSFDTAESRALLLQGFKDSSYKVRLEALQSVQKTKQQEAVPYVLYRAKYDPTEAVRLAAVETLAVLNTSEGNTWLSETFNDSKKSEKLRAAILGAAFKYNFSIVAGDLDAIVLQTVTDNKQKKLRYELGKEIAKHENSATSDICKAFLQSDDALTKSIGLDMFKVNHYADVRPIVETIAQDEKQGALQRRAQRLLEQNTQLPS